jgi:Fe-S-cluster containining protein
MESTMLEPFDYPEYARQVRKLSRGLICVGQNLADLSGAMYLLLFAVERDLARFGNSPENSRVACGPGCGACCVLNVEVLMPEAATIARYLFRRLARDELDSLKDRLRQLHIKTRWLDDEERLFVREPCAFLDPDDRCMIHHVRPLLCRAVTSTNPSSCHDAIAMIALDGAPSVEMDLFQKTFIDTVYNALADALKDLNLDYRPKRLTSAVLELLTEPGPVDYSVEKERNAACLDQ